jgi:hypothetical protein
MPRGRLLATQAAFEDGRPRLMKSEATKKAANGRLFLLHHHRLAQGQAIRSQAILVDLDLGP